MSCSSHTDFCHGCQECQPGYENNGCPNGKLSGNCVIYKGENGQCLNITKGMPYDDIIKEIDNKVCDFIAGSDRNVGATDVDPNPGSLIDKLADSDSITWSVVTEGGQVKIKGEVNISWIKEQLLSDPDFISEVCEVCGPVGTTTTFPVTTTTTVEPTTTTTTSSTTTQEINTLVQNSVVGGTITSVGNITGFSLGGPLTNGHLKTGWHNAFSGSVVVNITGVFTPSKLVLKKNGIILECLDVTSAGTHTFGAYVFSINDFTEVEFINEPCEQATTTMEPATTTTTTTTTSTTTSSTTTQPINVTVSHEGSSGIITSVTGVGGYSLPSTLSSGQYNLGTHEGFTSSISVVITGPVSASHLSLYRNGVLVQCLDVISSGAHVFNSYNFLPSDQLVIKLEDGLCSPTTTVPCNQPVVIEVTVSPSDATTTTSTSTTTTLEPTTTSTSTTTTLEPTTTTTTTSTTTVETNAFFWYGDPYEDDPFDDLDNGIDMLPYQGTFTAPPTGDISINFPSGVSSFGDGLVWVIKVPDSTEAKTNWKNGNSLFNYGTIGGGSLTVHNTITFGGYTYYISKADNPFYFNDSPTNNITLFNP